MAGACQTIGINMEDTTSTNFSYLSMPQREEYRKIWRKLSAASVKWDYTLPGDIPKIFRNKKALEQEVIDLEDLSLAAYRAMKTLRRLLKETNSILPEYICPCGQDLTEVNDFTTHKGRYFCSHVCMATYYQDRHEEAKTKAKQKSNNCQDCGQQLGTSYISMYNKFFCDQHCMVHWEHENNVNDYAG